MNLIFRNESNNTLFDIIECRMDKDKGIMPVQTMYTGLDFKQCQVIMGVDPDAPVRSLDGDRV